MLNFQAFLDRVHPDDRQSVETAVQRVMGDGGQFCVEYRVIHPNGVQRWILAMGSLLADAAGQPLELKGVSLDVTDRRTADEMLRQEKVLNEAVFDSVPGLPYLYTAEGNLVRWNKKHEELTGYTGSGLAKFKAADWFEGEDLAMMTREWEHAFTGGH